MTLRAMGPLNGMLPEPTGILVAFLRDPSTHPYLRYTQLVPIGDDSTPSFFYMRLDPDEAVRLTDLNQFAWAYDDYRPMGKAFTFKAEAIWDSVQRWDFPYTLGETTMQVWRKSGVNLRMVYDRVRANHAHLHRAVRIVNALTAASWPAANTGDLNALNGTAGAYFDGSSGTQKLPDGTPDPNFQIIRTTFQRINRRVMLATNNAVNAGDLIAVLPPKVAQAIALSGEMVEFLKQSRYADRLGVAPVNWTRWGLPEEYGGAKLVVEDTVRCFINQHADGTVADVTQPSQKDFLLDLNAVFFTSRPGKLTGDYGGRNYSTVQCFHRGGEARVEAFTEPKHQLVEGHVVMEDKVLTPALPAGFYLTGVLSPGYQALL